MNNNINKRKLSDALFSSTGGRIDKSAVNSAVNGDVSALIDGLPESDRRKLNDALDNPEKARQLLSSDAAKNLLKLFMNDGKGNG